MGSVHIGNVAEFNEQFLTVEQGDLRELIRHDCDTYAGIAPFFSEDPGLVVLARDSGDPRWWDLLAERLAWDSLTPHVIPTGIDEDLSGRARQDPVVRDAVAQARASGAKVLSWGETGPFRSLVHTLPDEVAPRSVDARAARAAESKSGSTEVFEAARLASDANVMVPWSFRCDDDAALIQAIEEMAEGGRGVILKSDFGVGGFGTALLQPEFTRSRDDCMAAVESLRGEDPRYSSWPLVVQSRVVRRRGGPGDLTGDGEVLPDGSVLYRGGAKMLVDGTHYAGAVTSCVTMASLSTWLEIEDFTISVGRVLSGKGYRGWFDVDFLEGVDGRLHALEINARRTGPVAPLTIARRLGALHGEAFSSVACLDSVTLPRRLSARATFDALQSTESGRSEWLVPTSFLGTEDPRPGLGLAVAAATAAEAMARLDQSVNELLRALL